MGRPRAEVIDALCLAGEGEFEEPSSTDCQGYATGGSMEPWKAAGISAQDAKNLPKNLCAPKTDTCCLHRHKGTAVSITELISSPQVVLAPRADVRTEQPGWVMLGALAAKNSSGNKGAARFF